MPFDLLGAARDLIAVDTVSINGNLGLAEPLRELAAQLRLELQVLEEDAAGTRHANYLFHFPDSRAVPPRPDPLLLLTHTDTVAPGPLERWTVTPPFTAKLEGDLLYGLGTADVKVDLLCKLLALDRVRGVPLARDVFVLGTYAEEIGLLGAKSFAKSGPIAPKFVVCGEPSELTIVHAHKGYLVARVTLGHLHDQQLSPDRWNQIFTGKAAHSGTPHLGENAILKALAAPETQGTGVSAIRGGQGANSVPVERTVELVDQKSILLPLADARHLAARFNALVTSLSPTTDTRFDPPDAVTNLGFIDGHDGQVEMLLDARLLPGHYPEAVAAAFEAEVKAIAGASVRFERQNPAVYTEPSGELCQAAVAVAAKLGLDPTLKTKATNTEAAAFAGRAEAIVFGPGRSTGNAHCANEHTRLREVHRAIDFYQGLILKLCQ